MKQKESAHRQTTTPFVGVLLLALLGLLWRTGATFEAPPWPLLLLPQKHELHVGSDVGSLNRSLKDGDNCTTCLQNGCRSGRLKRYGSHRGGAVFVLAVLTIPPNRGSRDAMRAMFQSFKPDVQIGRSGEKCAHTRVYFAVDNLAALDLVRAEALYREDRAFVNLESVYTGVANHFGEKLLKWYHRAVSLHPTVRFVGKLDDDVVACLPEVYSALNRIQGGDRVYFGFKYAMQASLGKTPLVDRHSRIDEMFVVLGRTLVDRILARPYCSLSNLAACCEQQQLQRAVSTSLCTSDDARLVPLVDTNYGGVSIVN